MLGIVTDAQFESELNGNHQLPEVTELTINHGRPNGRTEIPETIREFIAGEALSGAPADELSESFNISKSSISAYKHSATSTASYHSPNESLVRSNNETRQRIIGPAQSKLIAAIEAITSEKLDKAKVNIAASVARDMSSIIKNIEPDPSVVFNTQNRVIIYKPRMSDESDFETIVVEE